MVLRDKRECERSKEERILRGSVTYKARKHKKTMKKRKKRDAYLSFDEAKEEVRSVEQAISDVTTMICFATSTCILEPRCRFSKNISLGGGRG